MLVGLSLSRLVQSFVSVTMSLFNRSVLLIENTMMHGTNAVLASYLGILSFIILTTLSSVTNPALAQPMMMTSNDSSMSSIRNGMNFGTMNFANILNGSSLFGALGMSMVDGVKVTGVNILPNNDVHVTLKHIITNPMNTTLPGGVTVTAIRAPLNLRNLMSVASAVSNGTGVNDVFNMMPGPMQGFGTTKGGNSTSFMSNPFVFLKSIQIGSSSIANPNWSLPQSVTMGLVGMISNGGGNRLSSSTSTSTSTSSSSTSPQTADFVIVSVIPF